MDASLFWRLIADICKLGEFIATAGTKGASANIVGKFKVGCDGSETVIERAGCDDHIHCYPEQITSFKFRYCDLGQSVEPCLELINRESQVCLRFYYCGDDARHKYRQFFEQNVRHASLFAGEW